MLTYAELESVLCHTLYLILLSCSTRRTSRHLLAITPPVSGGGSTKKKRDQNPLANVKLAAVNEERLLNVLLYDPSLCAVSVGAARIGDALQDCHQRPLHLRQQNVVHSEC